MSKDERRSSPALDCLDLNFQIGGEETESKTGDGKLNTEATDIRPYDSTARAEQHVHADEENTKARSNRVDEVKDEGGAEDGKDDELDTLGMDCVDPDTHELHIEGEAMEEQETIAEGEVNDDRAEAEGDVDPRDQKIGPPILSPYLQIHQIDPSSKRALFVRKWQPKEDGGTLHLREQKEQKEGEGPAWTQKTRRFLRETLGQLGALLPKEGQKALLDDIRDFLTNNLSESELALRIKALVDAYEIIVPLDDGTGLHPWRNARSASSSTHRSTPATPSSEVAASPRGVVAGKRPRGEEEGRAGGGGGPGGEERAEKRATVAAEGEGSAEGRRRALESMRSAQLMQTPLSRHLTNEVNNACQAANPINVRVVGEKISTAGGYLHRCKAIFAFQKVGDDKEILLFAMYTNEYGTESQAPNAGRIYLECIDSVPLRPHESGEERDAVMRAILSAYFQYMRSCGFQYVHARVPPPNDVSCQIFARRPAHLRVQSAVWMTRWMRRMLRSAVQNKVIHRFNCGSHGRILNYPPTVLPSNHLLMEIIFAEKEDKICAGHDPSVVELLRERMFVIQLQPQPDHQSRSVDKAKPLPLTFASSRRDLNVVLMAERFAFHTVPHAVRSTHGLLRRLLDEQAKGPQVGERSAAASGSVRHWLDDTMSSSASQPLRLQLTKTKRPGLGGPNLELTPAEETCTSALEDELMEYNTWGKGGGPSNWMGGGGYGQMELDDEGSRGGHIHHQELNELAGGTDHGSLFNMDQFD